MGKGTGRRVVAGRGRVLDEKDMTILEADYLIVGAGAGGLAFADTLLSESSTSAPGPAAIGSTPTISSARTSPPRSMA
jgi:malic enzyme